MFGCKERSRFRRSQKLRPNVGARRRMNIAFNPLANLLLQWPTCAELRSAQRPCRTDHELPPAIEMHCARHGEEPVELNEERRQLQGRASSASSPLSGGRPVRCEPARLCRQSDLFTMSLLSHKRGLRRVSLALDFAVMILASIRSSPSVASVEVYSAPEKSRTRAWIDLRFYTHTHTNARARAASLTIATELSPLRKATGTLESSYCSAH